MEEAREADRAPTEIELGSYKNPGTGLSVTFLQDLNGSMFLPAPPLLRLLFDTRLLFLFESVMGPLPPEPALADPPAAFEAIVDMVLTVGFPLLLLRV